MTADAASLEPQLVIGQRPDGSPWVISTEFDGANVRIDSTGRLYLAGWRIDPEVARQRALALLAAVEWMTASRTAAVEKALTDPAAMDAWITRGEVPRG